MLLWSFILLIKISIAVQQQELSDFYHVTLGNSYADQTDLTKFADSIGCHVVKQEDSNTFKFICSSNPKLNHPNIRTHEQIPFKLTSAQWKAKMDQQAAQFELENPRVERCKNMYMVRLNQITEAQLKHGLAPNYEVIYCNQYPSGGNTECIVSTVNSKSNYVSRYEWEKHKPVLALIKVLSPTCDVPDVYE